MIQYKPLGGSKAIIGSKMKDGKLGAFLLWVTLCVCGGYNSFLGHFPHSKLEGCQEQVLTPLTLFCLVVRLTKAVYHAALCHPALIHLRTEICHITSKKDCGNDMADSTKRCGAGVVFCFGEVLQIKCEWAVWEHVTWTYLLAEY